jgi:hypothetical protein
MKECISLLFKVVLSNILSGELQIKPPLGIVVKLDFDLWGHSNNSIPILFTGKIDKQVVYILLKR